jgi:hypothetical protein
MVGKSKGKITLERHDMDGRITLKKMLRPKDFKRGDI